mmetsp:Transcript_1735/g.5462  ORF Transcript_1735/g.5462 Transcript_1735/m.5462 type:complete len:210 (+) Transcript_1735:927-1556(+)
MTSFRYSRMSETLFSLPPQPRDRARSLPVPSGTMARGTRSMWSSRSLQLSSAVRIHVTVPSPPQTNSRVSRSGARPSVFAKRVMVSSGSPCWLRSQTSPCSPASSPRSGPKAATRVFMMSSPVCPPLCEFTKATTCNFRFACCLKDSAKLANSCVCLAVGSWGRTFRSMPPNVRDALKLELSSEKTGRSGSQTFTRSMPGDQDWQRRPL